MTSGDGKLPPLEPIESRLRGLAERMLRGDLGTEEFVRGVERATCEALPDTTLDLDRQSRCGLPEVIFGAGKSPQTLKEIATRMIDRGLPVLITRISSEHAAALTESFPNAIYNSLGRTWRYGDCQSNVPADPYPKESASWVAIVTAGSTDRPVAEEALQTLRWMGVAVELFQDVGVAGPQRLRTHVPRLREATALVVAAGMEGALPSVVAGYVAAPVFAVPTSVGYGANLGGMAALLAMLNSCAANVAVVNIDAGFKAAYLAGMVARLHLSRQ